VRGVIRLAGAGAALVAGVLGVGMPTGSPAAASAGTTLVMPLQVFTNDGAGGRLWNAYDATAAASGPTVVGRPSAIAYAPGEQVFARSALGDLVQFVSGADGASAWSVYDLTVAASGPQIAGDPSAVAIGSSVYVVAPAPSGDLVLFTNDGSGSQLWHATDLSSVTDLGAVVGDASLLVVGSTLEVFVTAASGALFELSGTGSGARSWNATDLSALSAGPELGGSPAAIVYGTSSVHVYGTSVGGDLTEFVNDGLNGRPWNAYDLSVDAAGPQGSGTPSAVVYGPTVHVYLDAAGQLTEFVNDGHFGRVWNAYDLTAAADSSPVTGDPAAVTYGPVLVEIDIVGPGGGLMNYVNDGAGGRLWNAYSLTLASAGPTVGADPAVLALGKQLLVFAAGPDPPAVVQAIVAAAESQDQHNLAVVEDPPGSNCNIYTAYWGRGSTAGCAPGTAAEEWCSDFAEWAWAAAGVDTTGINGWAYTFVDWGEAHAGAWKPGPANDPAPGDAVVWGDISTGFAAHVGIVVGVSGGLIDVVSGNSGPPIDAQGDVDAVWESGYFDPTTSIDDGYPIIGYVAPTGWTGFSGHQAAVPFGSALAPLIATQDGGK
jgi:hypothetical protein